MRGNEILLVRLSYVKGWYLPGGGVNRGESFAQAMIRELHEECGVIPVESELLGIYFTNRQGKDDHVAVFVVPDFRLDPEHQRDPEIEEQRFFPVGDLPDDVTPATRRRIQEYLGAEEPSESW